MYCIVAYVPAHHRGEAAVCEKKIKNLIFIQPDAEKNAYCS